MSTGDLVTITTRQILNVALEEPQILTLSDRFEVIVPCPDEESICKEDGQTDHCTMYRNHSSGSSTKKRKTVTGDSLIKWSDSIL
eukprot:g47371.t1